MKANERDEFEVRESIHDRMIALSYGHGIGCGRKLTEDECICLRRLAQMVIRGVSIFETVDFCQPLGWDIEYADEIIGSLLNTAYERQIICQNGEKVWCGGNAAHISLRFHSVAENGNSVSAYTFQIPNITFDRVADTYFSKCGE